MECCTTYFDNVVRGKVTTSYFSCVSFGILICFLQNHCELVLCQVDPKKLITYCNQTSTNISTPDYFSPFYPLPYPNNSDCSKLIAAPPDHIVELEFRGRFNIEGLDCHILRNSFIPKRPIECYCQYDFLEVRDGPYGYSPLIGRFCGTIYPPNLRSTTRYMRLRFKSDDAIQYEGFYVVYKNVSYERKRDVWNATGCYIPKSDSKQGMVNSTTIPKRFINDAQTHGVPLDCIIEISVSNASQILLRFTELKLANPENCDMDFIDIHQSSLDFHNRIRQYCGDSSNQSLINSSKAILHFMSDPKKLDVNMFNAYYTVLKRSADCSSESDFDCGDGTCIAAELVCNKLPNCINDADEVNCDGLGWQKTTLQSVIISVVVGIIVLGVLAVAVYLTCNEKQISQPRRYFAPAPLHKAVTTDEFGFGCTVDEMVARSKEEELGYFVRRVPGPIVENVPKSILVRGHSSSELLENMPNDTTHTNSLPHTYRNTRHSRPNGQAVNMATPSPSRTRPRSQSPSARARSQSPSARQHRRLHFYEPVVVDSDRSVNLNNSIRDGIAVYMYSPNTKRKLKRVAN